MDVQQGNVLPPDRLEQLKTGMSRSQVRFVLGTPLVTDPFHPDRWDYVYYFRPGSTGQAETRHVSLFFRNDALQRIVDSAGGITPPAGNPAPPETPAP
jgi:outer membrane protein assembly factor BamE